MKQKLSALDLNYLIEEFKVLEGGKVDKIYQLNKKVFYFKFFVTGEGNKLMKLLIPDLMYFTNKNFYSERRPPGYCSFLRKYLDNAWIKGIKQHGFDRIIEIFFEKNVYEDDELQKKEYVLIIELFNPGNMILCKGDYTILSPLNGKDWSNRSIRKGLKYEFPPEMINVFNLDYKEFEKLIKGSNKENIVKTLAMDLGLGGVYAEEVCCGVVDKEEKNISDFKKLFDSFKELINRDKKPVIYNSKKGFPFPLKSFEGEYKEYDSFNEVIDTLIVEKKKKFRNKFTNIIKKQKENLVKIEKQAQECSEIGNKIYSNYQRINSLLYEINKLREEDGWEAVKEKYKGSKVVKKIDSKEGKVVIEI
jgi:predicted ribosome quality control (RQC) complex YloA/Tae2 family protein